jgi:hypothetical protein
MGSYLDMVGSLAAGALALYVVPLGIAVFGGLYMEKRRPPATVWSAYPIAVLVLCVILLLWAGLHSAGSPTAPLLLGLVAVGVMAALVLAVPLGTAQLLPGSLGLAVRAMASMVVGAVVTVVAAPAVALTVMCMLTGDCL